MKKALLFIALLVSSPLAAHDAAEHAARAAREAKAAAGEAVEGAKDKAQAAASSAGAAVQKAADKAGAALNGAVKEAVVVEEPLVELKEHARSHLHNKLVHFPIALGLFGAIFLLLSFRYPSYKWPARVLLLFAGIFALLAMPAGDHQSGEFEGSSLSKVLEWHAWAGLTTTILIWVSFLLSFLEASRKFYWVIALALIAAIALAGGLGGILAAS